MACPFLSFPVFLFFLFLPLLLLAHSPSEWGTQASYNYEDYSELMDMLWKRVLKDREGKYWRRIYKVGGGLE